MKKIFIISIITSFILGTLNTIFWSFRYMEINMFWQIAINTISFVILTTTYFVPILFIVSIFLRELDKKYLLVIPAALFIITFVNSIIDILNDGIIDKSKIMIPFVCAIFYVCYFSLMIFIGKREKN